MVQVVRLIQHLIRNATQPPVLFIATDTAHFIDTFRAALSAPNGTFWNNLAMELNNSTNDDDKEGSNSMDSDVITFDHFRTMPVVDLSQPRKNKGEVSVSGGNTEY